MNDGVLLALPAADALPQVKDALEAVVDHDLRGDGAAVAGGAVDQKVLVFVSRDFLCCYRSKDVMRRFQVTNQALTPVIPLKQLGYERVTARVLELSDHGLKAAMIDLNRKKGSIGDLEEGLVVHSLCREDGLSQVEAAVLLGRHKSWVCRRLSLIERLCDEALSHIGAGIPRLPICSRISWPLWQTAGRFQLRKKYCEALNKVLVIVLLQEYLATLYPSNHDVVQNTGCVKTG